jgi:hypothetical protein
VTVGIVHTRLKPEQIAAGLRQNRVPIIGYIDRGTFKVDLRTIFDHQDQELIHALHSLPA